MKRRSNAAGLSPRAARRAPTCPYLPLLGAPCIRAEPRVPSFVDRDQASEALGPDTCSPIPISSCGSNPETSIGAAVKQRKKITAAPAATRRRVRSRGRWSSTVRGWCGPSVKSINTSNPAQNNQLSDTNVRKMAHATVPTVTSVEREPKTAYEIWPPSSWPKGNRFSIVTSSPNQAASPIG